VDITWYMAAVVITLDEDTISNAGNMMLGEPGPEVRVQKSTPPQWHDPEAGPGGKLTDDYGWYEGEEDGRVVNEDGVEQPMDGIRIQRENLMSRRGHIFLPQNAR